MDSFFMSEQDGIFMTISNELKRINFEETLVYQEFKEFIINFFVQCEDPAKRTIILSKIIQNINNELSKLSISRENLAYCDFYSFNLFSFVANQKKINTDNVLYNSLAILSSNLMIFYGLINNHLKMETLLGMHNIEIDWKSFNSKIFHLMILAMKDNECYIKFQKDLLNQTYNYNSTNHNSTCDIFIAQQFEKLSYSDDVLANKVIVDDTRFDEIGEDLSETLYQKFSTNETYSFLSKFLTRQSYHICKYSLKYFSRVAYTLSKMHISQTTKILSSSINLTEIIANLNTKLPVLDSNEQTDLEKVLMIKTLIFIIYWVDDISSFKNDIYEGVLYWCDIELGQTFNF